MSLTDSVDLVLSSPMSTPPGRHLRAEGPGATIGALAKARARSSGPSPRSGYRRPSREKPSSIWSPARKPAAPGPGRPFPHQAPTTRSSTMPTATGTAARKACRGLHLPLDPPAHRRELIERLLSLAYIQTERPRRRWCRKGNEALYRRSNRAFESARADQPPTCKLGGRIAEARTMTTITGTAATTSSLQRGR